MTDWDERQHLAASTIQQAYRRKFVKAPMYEPSIASDDLDSLGSSVRSESDASESELASSSECSTEAEEDDDDDDDERKSDEDDEASDEDDARATPATSAAASEASMASDPPRLREGKQGASTPREAAKTSAAERPRPREAARTARKAKAAAAAGTPKPHAGTLGATTPREAAKEAAKEAAALVEPALVSLRAEMAALRAAHVALAKQLDDARRDAQAARGEAATARAGLAAAVAKGAAPLLGADEPPPPPPDDGAGDDGDGGGGDDEGREGNGDGVRAEGTGDEDTRSAAEAERDESQPRGPPPLPACLLDEWSRLFLQASSSCTPPPAMPPLVRDALSAGAARPPLPAPAPPLYEVAPSACAADSSRVLSQWLRYLETDNCSHAHKPPPPRPPLVAQERLALLAPQAGPR